MYTQSVRDTDWVPAHDDIYSLSPTNSSSSKVQIDKKIKSFRDQVHQSSN